ncbi:MAG TPA: hypothetical protein VLG71_02795, partial [Candidatus Limnocylindria bacterium]|nr:hypothetical protein [Candidatus Limnocylindria bacterium]
MNAELFSLIMAGIIAFVCTFCIVPLCIRLAYSINFVDVPDGKHKQHVRITPYLGGVAVYLGFFIAFVLTSPGHVSYLFFGGITLLLMIGLFDDFKPITPRQKFIGQCMATLCFLQAGFYLKEQFFYSFLNIFISAFWIVSLINAFNLIDIMDGLATVTALGA